MEDILKKDGLSFELLEALSYRSELGIRLKKNLHYFDKQELFDELMEIHKWYLESIQLRGLSVDYRIKSIQSALLNMIDTIQTIRQQRCSMICWAFVLFVIIMRMSCRCLDMIKFG